MRITTTIIKRLIKRKVATAVLITASLAAFATLGDGGKKGAEPTAYNPRSFSLRQSYQYKGNNLFAYKPGKFIMLNTVVTYQRGNATYIMPLKKKVLLDKIKFNPAPQKF